MNKYKEVNNYFKNKAEDYDLVEEQIYWNLSDALLWEALKKYVLNKMPETFCVFDAGGGTGRWTKKILEEYPESNVVLYDLSQEMLTVAKRKMASYVDRVTILNGNLEDIDIPDNTFDVTINFHNVLGFVDDLEKCVKEITRVTKRQGMIVSFIPNLYHLIYFNISNGNIEEALKAEKTKMGRFTDDMPEMHLFTPSSISDIYMKNAIDTITLTGFPATIYPNIEETRIKGSSDKLVKILDDQERFGTIFNIEMSLMDQNDIASRGNNIFIVGVKR